jgi:hypothetical protein
MFKGLAISVAIASVLAVTVTSAASAAAGSRSVRGPDGVSVDIVAIYNAGCPEDTVWAETVFDSDQLVMEYEQYWTESGGSSTPLNRRKSCMVVLRLNVPEGYTYAISSSSDSGYAQLEDGAKATVKLGYYFEGAPRPWVTHTVSGAFSYDWEFTDRPPSDLIIWKPCGEDRNLVVISELAVDQGTSDPAKTNYIAMSSVSDRRHHLYNLAWKTCP